MEALIQRHHDYVLGPNQDTRLASVAAGASISLALSLDSDAPFVLRSRALRCRYSVRGRRQTGLNHLLMRWSGPDRDFRSQHVVRQSLYGPYFGQIGNPLPVYPQVFYPRNSTINVEISNDGASAITNLTMYFRGVKLFGAGAVRAYAYPARCATLPFVYPQNQVTAFPVAGGPVRYTFRCKADADFVLRGLQAGDPFDTVPWNEVSVQFRDEEEKPYSNDALHLDVIAGNSDYGAAFAAGSSGGVAPVGGGPNSPGLFFPEIYIPKNHVIYFDVTRNDTYAEGAAAVNIPIQFIGAKVFQK